MSPTLTCLLLFCGCNDNYKHNYEVFNDCREPVKIIGGSGPDPLTREVGAAKVKDMLRGDVRRTMVPPEKELPVKRERERQRLQEELSSGVQPKRDRAGLSRRTRTNGAEAEHDGGDADDVEDGKQPLVVLVAEDGLFTVEAKREELKRSRLALVAACCKVRRKGFSEWGSVCFSLCTRPCEG